MRSSLTFIFSTALAVSLCGPTDAQAVSEEASPRPLVFSRKQHKYNHFANYREFWNDRPLFHDRSERYPLGSFAYFTPESIAQEIREVRMYELDGLSAFVHSGRHYEGLTAILNEQKPEGYLFKPEIAGPPSALLVDGPEGSPLDRALRTATTSASTWRLGDRVIVTSYVADRYPPQEWKPVVERLHSKHQALFVADLAVTASALQRAYELGTLNAPMRRNFKQTIRTYLDVADGIMVANANHIDRQENHRYPMQFDIRFYSEELIPLLKEVLAEQRYQGKLLGLSASKAYINKETGVIHAENGTKRLRQSFDAARQANPTFIVLPEWNEVNENTSFQPTVASSFSTARILRSYLREMKGETPAAMPGDDLSIPNLVVSYRRALKLGEELRVEILNIPDGTATQPIKVSMLLKDSEGKVIHESEERTLAGNTLEDVTFALPTESISAERVLRPSISITDHAGKITTVEDGLLYIQLRPTWNTDYLEVHQPLRDLLHPSKVNFSLSPAEGGDELIFEASIDADEELAQVEILEDRREVAAVDPSPEFDLEKNVVIRGQLIGNDTKVFKGTLTVSNAETFQFRPNEYPSTGLDYRVEGNVVHINQRINRVPRGFFLILPRAGSEAVELDFEFNNGSFKVPLKQLLADGASGKTFPGRYTLTLWNYTETPDIPLPLGKKRAQLSGRIATEAPFAAYHLRAITKSGKIYRSKPIIPSRATGSPMKLNVFSESKREVVAVSVPEDEILHLKYRFSPTMGDLLPSSGGTLWTGELGGGLIYGGAGNLDPSFPPDATSSNPLWVQEDGAAALEFDGKGHYVAFPVEALPHGSFTLSFEIKPTGPDDRGEVLFRHHGRRMGSLTLLRRNGRLAGAFTDSRPSPNHINTTTPFITRLALPQGQWSSVSVAYNLKTLTFTVNGESESFPFSQQAASFNTSAFGGNTIPQFGVMPGEQRFKGFLRAFGIRHHAETQPD